MPWIREWMVIATAVSLMAAAASAQSFGPTATEPVATDAIWPAAPPSRIYVLPFTMDPALQEELRQQATAGVIPQGPVRQFLGSRPRVVDAVTGYDRSEPPGVGVARLVATEMAQAGWPAVFWTEPTPPPADGWRLMGQVTSLEIGRAHV